MSYKNTYILGHGKEANSINYKGFNNINSYILCCFVTEAMIYTMPMLAACTLVAANLYDEKENENRVDEDGSNDGGESADGDGLDG